MRNGYTITDAGLLVRPEDAAGETYLPANHELATLPIAPVDNSGESGESAAAVTAPAGVEVSNQGKQSTTARSATGPLQRLVTRRRRGRSETEAERAGIASPAEHRLSARIRTAGRLETLKTDPDAQAHSNRRSRALLLGLSGSGIGLGVAISAATAQSTITSFMGWAAGSFASLAAYGADPALGLVLFAVLGLRALASTRGVVLPPTTATAFTRIEFGLFALVAVLNIGPSVGHLVAAVVQLQWAAVGPAAMVLVIHALGPVLVASGVYGVPHMLTVFDRIRTATTSGGGAPVGAGNQQRRDRYAAVPAKWHADLDTVLVAIEDGQLPCDPSGTQIHAWVGGDAGKKKPLREAVAGYRPQQEMTA
ncbi:hypothetical protein FHX42_004480 [Saccharopolyspora lacisalsi]|uniref:Uncharacterized protein n=1 Tax=Halosaccharopolyspora lacisalsi TaxID=1000566 RepID=A0A839E3D8_9PSEU|nr:hypothetical protein [Halosaccharopolyspora lacisalsi]MBA8827096.1 hypothetical protein [Halosaccharopolyspora lacisalsi]